MLSKLRAGAVVAAFLLVPAVALAGKRVVSGQQSLQIKAKLTPRKPGHRATESFHIDYEGPAPGVQPPYNVKTISIVSPKGLTLNPKAAPACKRSALDRANGNASVCPTKSLVGSGTVVINAAPTIPAPISGTVSLYNAINDTGAGGEPKGTRNLVFYAKTSVGVNSTIGFRIIRLRDGRMDLLAKFTKAPTPGGAPGSFSIQKVDVTINGSGRKAYITNPATCRGGWSFAMTITNWSGAPSVTAHDKAPCHA